MPAGPRDDFAVFEDSEHMFHGLVDPYGIFRGELEAALRQQASDCMVESIAVHDEPKWLTLTRRSGDSMVIAYFGVCFRARVRVVVDYGHEELATTQTFLFGRWDDPEQQRCRTYFDLRADADRSFDDDLFRRRFLAFREDEP